ncbi:MAG: hypothetical protein QXF82_00870 [Nitrososphaeria archaeon]
MKTEKYTVCPKCGYRLPKCGLKAHIYGGRCKVRCANALAEREGLVPAGQATKFLLRAGVNLKLLPMSYYENSPQHVYYTYFVKKDILEKYIQYRKMGLSAKEAAKKAAES